MNTFFEYWTRDKLRKKFGLKRVINHPLLTEWINSSCEITDFETLNLKYWREKMLLYLDYWNEEEVKLKFIGNIISLVGYDSENISAFAERELKGIVGGEEISGFPDFMVASGKQEVEAPFFFLHEYKKELDNNSPDPAGQCLAAMLLAYELNLQIPKLCEKPIYGAYVIGRNCFFVILKNREFCISDAYVSTHLDNLMDIFRILKVSKTQINEIWGD
ncbi:MAG: hypothetical protein EAZ97_08330 [Bacteroidetes bacterium]|nr:MAG: hypothetical protein EAZ97_08330 [Bacteroidota bacterium]